MYEEERLEDALVKELSNVMHNEFWNYFKASWNNTCEIDIDHFIRADGYRLIIDGSSRRKLKKDLLNNIIAIWGEIRDTQHTDKVKKEMLKIVFNAMGEFIRFKISNLGEKHYRRDIKALYNKYNSEKTIIERYDNEIRNLQIRLHLPPLIYPPFLPSDAFHLALYDLEYKDIPMTLAKKLLKIAFNKNEYQLSQQLIAYREKNLNLESIKEDKTYCKPQNSFYMLELQNEIEHEEFSKNINIPTEWCVNDEDNKKLKAYLDNPKIVIYD